MKSEQRLFISLLKKSIWNIQINESDFKDCNWNAIFKLSQEQCCEGVIYDAVSNLKDDLLPQQTLLSNWFKYSLQLEKRTERHVETLKKVFILCRKYNIEPILLKGLSCASFYPDYSKRSCGDIDVFSFSDDVYTRLIKLLNEENLYKGKQLSQKHYETEIDNVCVEFHYELCDVLNPFKKKNLNKIINENKENTEIFNIGDFKGETLPNELNAVFLLAHIVDHLAEKGIGLRQITDFMLFISKKYDFLNKEKISEYLKSLDLFSEWKLIMTLCVDSLGLPQNYALFYDGSYSLKAEKLLLHIFKYGNFGNNIEYNVTSNYVSKKCEGLKQNFLYFCDLIKIAPKIAVLQFFFKYPLEAFLRLRNE